MEQSFIPYAKFSHPVARQNCSLLAIVHDCETERSETKAILICRSAVVWPIEQSFIPYAKFDCPVARQNCSLLAIVHDCETERSETKGDPNSILW